MADRRSEIQRRLGEGRCARTLALHDLRTALVDLLADWLEEQGLPPRRFASYRRAADALGDDAVLVALLQEYLLETGISGHGAYLASRCAEGGDHRDMLRGLLARSALAAAPAGAELLGILQDLDADSDTEDCFDLDDRLAPISGALENAAEGLAEELSGLRSPLRDATPLAVSPTRLGAPERGTAG